MWQIQNPRKVFDYVYSSNKASFELVAIIPLNKYEKFDNSSKDKIENICVTGFSISDFAVKDPNNPADLIDCKLIKYLI